jgi:hypothetical protein
MTIKMVKNVLELRQLVDSFILQHRDSRNIALFRKTNEDFTQSGVCIADMSSQHQELEEDDYLRVMIDIKDIDFTELWDYTFFAQRNVMRED